ncbi:peptidoglycan-binding protein [Streptomyces sp. NPDC002755]|uniref:peptidoglycan-binding protein n=1 Tax=Streptomyces sp. NPDC002884 TaxID=3154544 RepID=UPI003332D15E
MSRWKALSTELDPRVRQLLTQLRRLKDHSGLSMRQLAAKTAYSEKSWERYLGGRSLPPREAVEALARIGGVDPVRLLALHEVAADTWAGGRHVAPSAPQEPAPEPAPAPAPAPAPTVGPTARLNPALDLGPAPDPETEPETESVTAARRSLRVALVAGAVALVLALSSAALLIMRLDHGDGGPAAAPPAASTAAAPSSAPAYTCRIERADGLWYAGISRTRDTELAYGAVGPEVAEAQCLLRRAGISPGGIDGMFGPLTQRAVKAFQTRAGLAVDGSVGPNTWKALRG